MSSSFAEKMSQNFMPSKTTVATFLNSKLHTTINEADLKGMKITRTKSSNLPIYTFHLHSLEKKSDILKQRSMLRGTNIFIEESLTAYNRTILFEARKLKRAKKIKDCYSINGRPVIKHDGKINYIQNIEDLKKFSS